MLEPWDAMNEPPEPNDEVGVMVVWGVILLFMGTLVALLVSTRWDPQAADSRRARTHVAGGSIHDALST
jgi:hypothetical protein